MFGSIAMGERSVFVWLNLFSLYTCISPILVGWIHLNLEHCFCRDYDCKRVTHDMDLFKNCQELVRFPFAFFLPTNHQHVDLGDSNHIKQHVQTRIIPIRWPQTFGVLVEKHMQSIRWRWGAKLPGGSRWMWGSQSNLRTLMNHVYW